MILLNRGAYNPGNANAVAAHRHDLILAIRILHGGRHGLAVHGTQLKDVTDFDTARDTQ